MNIYSLFVVVCEHPGSNVFLATDDVFDSVDKAKEVRNHCMHGLPPSAAVAYTVMSLDDFLNEVKQMALRERG